MTVIANSLGGCVQVWLSPLSPSHREHGAGKELQPLYEECSMARSRNEWEAVMQTWEGLCTASSDAGIGAPANPTCREFSTRKRKWFFLQCVVKPWSSWPQDVTDAKHLNRMNSWGKTQLLNTESHHQFLKAARLLEAETALGSIAAPWLCSSIT